jgi:hypothetical protein
VPSTRRGISAWLVTWEGVGGRAHEPEKIAAILSPRFSVRRVEQVVELLYMNASYSLSERIAWTKSRKNNPYLAQSHGGHVVCGHNPFLDARLVDNLRTEGQEGDETPLWDERPRREIRIPKPLEGASEN